MAAAGVAAPLSRETGALRSSLIDRQGAAIEVTAIQASDCPLQVFTFSQLHKTKSPRLPRHLVENYNRRSHLKTRLRYEFV